MKNRGINFVAIPVIVVVVILIGVGYFFLTQSPKEGLLVYPGATPSEVSGGLITAYIALASGATPSEVTWEPGLLATFESHGISVSAYTTGASSNEVLDWYRSEMSGRGWTKVLDNTFDSIHFLSFQKANEGVGVIENMGALILLHGTIEQFQAVVVEWYQEPSGYEIPVLAAHPGIYDNTIRINVVSGSISAGDWEYSVSSAEGSYSWTTGTEELDSPHVTLGTFTQGTYYVSLRHKPSGHIYFADQEVTIT